MASWTAAHAPGVHSGDVEEVKARVKPALYITAAGRCERVGERVCECAAITGPLEYKWHHGPQRTLQGSTMVMWRR